MTHIAARISSKGQITIPARVRDFFDLKEGDRLDFYIDENGRSVRILARNKKLADLAGIANSGRDGGAPVSIEEMDRAIGDHVSEKHQRISDEWNEWREFQDWRATRKGHAAE